MSLSHVIVLAVVQGLTEFLPISSTAHLYIFPWLLHWPDGGLAFDVALHAGTLGAVLLYFFRTWIVLVLNGFGIRFPANATDAQHNSNRRIFWLLVVGTIPAGLAGLVFEHAVESLARNPIPIAIALIVVGLLMALADSAPMLTRTIERVNLKDSLFIGGAQALAIFPGVSRSGITMIGGIARKLTRETAAEFSFLLSMPVIAAAALMEIPKVLTLQHNGQMEMSPASLAVGVAVSALVGYFVIDFFLRYLQTRTLKIFVVYRIAFGIVILLLVFLRRGTAP